jgi:hypothetical protein
MLLVAAAVPGIDCLRCSPIVTLKRLELVTNLRIDAQILLNTLVRTQTQKAAIRIGLRTTEITPHTIVIRITEAPALEARVNDETLPVPRLGLLDLLKLVL